MDFLTYISSLWFHSCACPKDTLLNQSPPQPGKRRKPVVHFTVTGANEAGVDLALIQPFPLYHVKSRFLGSFWPTLYSH